MPGLMDVFALKSWFEEEKRNLPWRENPTPYAVWVSEVMLQQTQVAVVIPYFERWMQRFPTIKALAAASVEEVLKTWEGLGYYSRARNLHEAARQCVDELPQSYEGLSKIKGLGPYTIGAILSFAFHQKAPAIDGNVIRVLTRFFLVDEDVSKASTKKRLHVLTEDLLPDQEPWVIMEALIELGAQICQKEPKCGSCPIQDSCLGFQTGKAPLLPKKDKKTKTIFLKREVLVIRCHEEILIRKGEKGKVMADLYEFPYFEDRHTLQQTAHQLGALFEKPLPKIKHSFTQFRVELFPLLWKAFSKQELEGFQWIPLKEARLLPFSSGHRRILSELV